MLRHVSLRSAGVLAALFIIVSASPVAAVDGWVGPTQISDRAGGNVALVLGPTGKPHIAFPSEYGVYYMTRQAGAWVRQRVTQGRHDDWVRIALDGAGHVHITFHRLIPCDPCDLWPSKGIYHASNPGDYDASVAAKGANVDVAFGRDGVGIVHKRHVTGVPG